ncbi:unnamed protein product [Echinostoma caproni]|uniref:Reverse transcriptase domain-containing protein n=1 Tax=Echinostoma caproni TaxID=27848 RepID=A0A183APW1_9TREM|nr:unnamed protein product [Echinostoma caproni]
MLPSGGIYRFINFSRTRLQTLKPFVASGRNKPHHLRYPPVIKWTSIWPSAATFNYSVVPLPIRQGYCKNSGISPEKYANAELMKIPNFLHLTKAHIQMHCAALKKFCTDWPSGLQSAQETLNHYPLEVIQHSYAFSASTLRDPRARIVSIKVSWACATRNLSRIYVRKCHYADNIALLGGNTQVVQNALNRLAIEVSMYAMCFAPFRCKVLVQEWQEPVPAPILCGDQLEVVESFKYLGSLIASGGGVGEETTSRIAKARVTFANLRYLWRRHDIRLSLKGRVYIAAVRSVFLYGCETRPLCVEGANRLSVFDHRCLRSIARIWWEHRVSNDEVVLRVLGADSRSLTEVIALHRFQWLGHVLRMPAHRLHFRALFAFAGQGRKKRRGVQTMTWRRCMKKLASALASVGAARLPGWGPKDEDCRWLETLRDMAQSRSE